MTPELKALWIAALRSGDYKQGTGALRNPDNTWCCLGVLGHITDHREGLGTLPSSILEPSIQGKLINLNDSARLTFPEIALWIEDEANVPTENPE